MTNALLLAAGLLAAPVRAADKAAVRDAKLAAGWLSSLDRYETTKTQAAYLRKQKRPLKIPFRPTHSADVREGTHFLYEAKTRTLTANTDMLDSADAQLRAQGQSDDSTRLEVLMLKTLPGVAHNVKLAMIQDEVKPLVGTL
jgi:hypothetical protein